MTFRDGSTLPDAESASARRRAILEGVFSRWRGRRADARAALQDHPELAAEKSLAIELAYVAFYRRKKGGESLDLHEYCREFPEIESSLRQILEVDRYLSSNSGLGLDDESFEWPQPEEQIGDFELLKEIGRGAFSRVYLARDRSLGARLVALKASRMDVGEAQTLGRLNHPHIVPIYSVISEPESDFVYICMPFCGEATLADCLQQAVRPKASLTGRLFRACATAAETVVSHAQLPGVWNQEPDYLSAVVRIGIALAEALQHAHDKGILHLDLKPSNVLIASDGRPLLLDFNLSQDEQALRRRLGGTLPYMAPEVLSSLCNNTTAQNTVDGRADVFGLGVLLYQLVTLRLPFPVDRIDQPFGQLATAQIRLISSGLPSRQFVDKGVDRRLLQTIDQCLGVSPTDRPSSAGEVASRLRRCLAPDVRLERNVRRNPAIAMAVLATAALALAAIATYFAIRPSEYQRQFESGMVALAAGNSTESVAYFNRALEANPRHVESLIARAKAYHHNGDYFRALESVDEANHLQATPDGLAASCYFACRLNRFNKAIEAGEQFGRFFAKDPRVLNNLGYALLKTGRSADALDTLTAACESESAPIAAFANRAAIELMRTQNAKGGNSARGISDLRRVLATRPSNGEPYFQLAYLLARSTPRNAELISEVRELLKMSVSFGARPEFLNTIGPSIPEISAAELKLIGTTPVASASFLFERLAAPF